MKMTMRKMLAILATLAMLCAVLPLGSMLFASADNDVVLNATFDGGETDGILSSSDISVVDGALQFNVNKDWGNVYYGFETEANTDYEISFRAKSKLGKSFWVKLHKSDWTGDIGQRDVSIGKDWKDYSVTINSGANTYVYMLVQFAGYASEGETLWFDNITIKKVGGGSAPVVPDAPADGNLITNGDFESGNASGWETWQSTSISADAAKDSAYGAHLVGSGTWGGMLNQTATVEAGKEYKLSFWINVNAVGVNVQVKDGSGKGIEGAGGWFDANKKDTLVEWTFTATDDKVLINFCGGGTGAAEDAYVDNFSLVCTTSDEPVAPSEGNLIVNGDFETGDATGWETWQSTAISADAAKDGAYGAHLQGNGSWGGMLNQTMTVEAGKEYKLSFWINVNAVGVNVQVKDGSGKGIEGAGGWFDANKKDTLVEWTFTATDDKVLINFCGGGTGTAEDAYVDNFSLTAVGGSNPDAPSALVTNGDFETGDHSGWEKHQSTVISEEAAHSGKYGANLMGDGGWGGMLNQDIAVEKGETYVITLWVCVNSSGVNLQIKGADKVEEECDNTYLDAKELSGWTQRTFTVVANSDTITLNFCGGGTTKAEDVYLDDIVVVKKGETPPAPPVDDTYPIKNAGFETGDLTSWKNLWDSCVVGFDTPGHDKSQYALNFEGPGAWNQVRQDGIPVEPNTDYTLIAYVKNPININLVVKTGNDSANIADYAVENDLSNSWIRHEVSFNSGDQTEVCVLIISNADGNGTAIVDNVQIYKKGEEPAEPEPDKPATEGPMQLEEFGVSINRPASPEANLIVNGSFEDAEGGQWQSIIGDTLYVVDDETAPEGNKSLFFNTSGVTENNKVIFYMDVEPETTYVFSAWVKGAFISDDNRFNATFGVTDWKDNFCVYQDALFSNKNRQIVPTAWDNEWHLRAVQFNTGVNNKIGIGFAGAESQMWIDGIALYTVDNGIKYGGVTQNDYIIPSTLYENEGSCADEHNLIADATMSGSAAVDFWSTAEGYKNGFVSFAENKYEYGTSMKYVGDEKSCYTNMIKWIEVKPNTTYTFSVDARVVTTGGGSLNLLDGKKRDCFAFLMIDFDQYGYGTDWFNVTIEFNTGDFDRIGIAIVDGGGEALIDNMRLFESANRIAGGVTDDYVKPPYNFGDPEDPNSPDTGVSMMGAVLAVALVPSSAAVAFVLRRKKEDEE